MGTRRWMASEVAEPWRAWLLLVPRVALGLGMAVGFGVPKITRWEGYSREVASSGVAMPMVVAIGLMAAELAGGVMLAIGLWTRAASASILLAMLGVLVVPKHGELPWDAVAFALGGYLYMVLAPGRLSVDHIVHARTSRGRTG